MNDLSVASPVASETFEQITLHMAAITEASAGCQHILTQNQSFREKATLMLRPRLENIGRRTGLAIFNPDAIFFNRRLMNSSFSSISMTDLLIELVRPHTSLAEFREGAFYTRIDSLDPAHAVTAVQNQELLETVEWVAKRLVSSYRTDLTELWSTKVDHPGDPERFASTEQILIEQKRSALMSEITLCGYAQRLSSAEQDRLNSAVSGESTEGVFALSGVATDGTLIMMPSVYVVSEPVQNPTGLSGGVFLVMPSAGIERFESMDELREALSMRISKPDCEHCLRDLMLLEDQARLTGGETITPDAWQFEATDDPLLNLHVQAVQHKQMEDFQFLLRRKESVAAAFHADLDRVQVCAHVDDAMGRRFNALTQEMEELVQPHWRRYADQEKKDYLMALEKAHQERKNTVDGLLKGVESINVFAHDEITGYIHRHFGCFIDPNDVQLTLRDSMELDDGEMLDMTYRKSLLEYAVKGIPAIDGTMEVSPAPVDLHTEFSDSFVRAMIDELNLPQRYEALLRERYTNEETLRAMTHHRDSAIALGAWAALMQGHIRQDRSRDLIHMIRADASTAGVQYNMGSLHLAETGARFKDLIVFEEKTDSDEHYVLYAPGASNGQDFFEFSSWRQLCFGVGGWLTTESGCAYVHEQLAGPGEGASNAFISNVLLKPVLWGPDSCVFMRCTGGDYERDLSQLVSAKAVRTVDALKQALPAKIHQTSFANLSILALMEARMEALNAEFVRLSPGLTSLRDYVHTQTSRILNQFLSRQGYKRVIDPDTLYVGLGLPYQESPDFSAYTELQNVTDLMMFGSEDILKYRPQIHLYSSTGLDVTKLPEGFIGFLSQQIETADLGAGYMDFLTSEFLGRQSPVYYRRRAVMAKRVQYDMMRRSLKAFLNGSLSDPQYSWVRQTIIGLNQSAPDVQSNETSCVSAFKIAGRIIEGVYIFRDFSTSDRDYNLLYTPDSPDGISFRPLTDYADLLASATMRSYYYGRAAYDGQPAVGTFFDDLLRGKKSDPEDIRIVNRPEARIIDAQHIYGDMIGRMIADADSQIESVAEKRLALAWLIIKWTGTVLLLPFPVVSFAWDVVTTTVTFIQAFDAYAAGDRATALPLFVFGVLGLVSGGDSVRAFVAAGQGLAKTVASRAGLWAWNKLELGRSFPVPA
jgi:hypothetical protein